MWSRSKQEARACEIEMLGTIVQDMVFPEKGIRLCKDPGVRRNCGCSGLLSLGGRETGSRYADVGLHISCSPLGSWRKGGWVGSERKGGSPHLHLGLTLTSECCLWRFFRDLTWRVGSLESETAPSKGPKFARGPPLGSPSVSAPSLQPPSPQSPRPALLTQARTFFTSQPLSKASSSHA